MTDLKNADERTVAPPAPVRRRPVRWALATVIAVGVTAGVATAVVTSSAEPASAAVLAAADKTGAVDSLRIAMSVTPGDNTTVTIGVDMNGTDYRAVTRDDSAGDSETVTVTGGTRYITTGGRTEREQVPAGEQVPSFAEAASSIIRAAAGDANTERVGTDVVRGVETEHYRLTVNQHGSGRNPMAAIPDEQLELFGLADVIAQTRFSATIDVWVADNLVRRFDIAADSDDWGGPDVIEAGRWRTSTEFYDFGAPITITAPTGS